MSTTAPHDAAQQKHHKKHNHHKFQFDFSTTEDLFISTKGRELRNKQKKLDKIVALEKQTKKGDVQINDTQKEMVASKEQLKDEVKELEALVELYVKSNPNYLRKDVEEKKVEEVVVVKKVVDEATI
jgi:seryl-tRNA synthetase